LIVGQVETLLQVQTFTPNIYHKILGIYKNSLQLRELITELLDFRKQEQGHMKIKVSRHNLVNFLYENYLLFLEYASSKQINFKFNKQSDDIEVWYDQKQMQKVVNNLLSNALKFTSMGAVTLEVYKTHQREDVVELTFFVTDTGIGIDAQGRQKLFQSFSQADDSITRRYGGTGLGLYVTKQLAEQMHGHIEVESEPGRGSTFSCAIKVKVPVQAVKQEKEQNIEFDISNLKNHLLGTQAKSRMEQVYMYGSAANRRELAINMEKLVLCIEMENWEKAEGFAENIKTLCAESGEQTLKSRTFRLLMAVRKEDYKQAIGYSEEIRTILKLKEPGAEGV